MTYHLRSLEDLIFALLHPDIPFSPWLTGPIFSALYEATNPSFPENTCLDASSLNTMYFNIIHIYSHKFLTDLPELKQSMDDLLMVLVNPNLWHPLILDLNLFRVHYCFEPSLDGKSSVCWESRYHEIPSVLEWIPWNGESRFGFYQFRSSPLFQLHCFDTFFLDPQKVHGFIPTLSTSDLEKVGSDFFSRILMSGEMHENFFQSGTITLLQEFRMPDNYHYLTVEDTFRLLESVNHDFGRYHEICQEGNHWNVWATLNFGVMPGHNIELAVIVLIDPSMLI